MYETDGRDIGAVEGLLRVGAAQNILGDRMGARAVRWCGAACHAAVVLVKKPALLRLGRSLLLCGPAMASSNKFKLGAGCSRPIGRAFLVAGAIAAVFGVAYAGGITVIDRPRPDYDAKGVPLGAFRLFPTLDLRFNTSNNVFQTETANEGDVNLEVAPAFKLASEWSQHAVEVFARLNAFRYADHSSENLTDWAVGADGRLDIQRGSAAFAGVSHARSHEGRSSPNSPGNIAEPVRFSQFHAHGSVAIQPNRLRASLGGEFDRYSYDATPLNGGGFLSNRDRDRDEYRLRARVSLEVSEGYLAFFEAGHDERLFDTAVDRTGVNRDSSGSSVNGGVEFKLVEFLQGEVFVGYLDRQFGAPLQDFSGLNYGSTLKWSPTPLTTVHLSAARVLSETTVAGSSVIEDDTFGIGVDHELRRNVILQANVTHTDSSFVGIARDDSHIGGRVGATYLIDDNLSATAGYEHRERDSSAPGEDFSEDKFDVGLRFQL
jgi:hypothetical protein